MILSVFREVCIPITNMRAGQKTSSIVLLFVVLVCGQVIATGQQRVSLPTDESVSVVRKQRQVSVSPSDIKSCMGGSKSLSFRVRFQKLKVKTATFTRTLLNGVSISTYASDMKTLNTTNIVNCVNVTEAEGFVGFSFKLGTCNMFNMKYQTCGCQTGATDVFYVRPSFWDPKDSALPQVEYNGGYGVAVVHLPSTVYDKQHLFVGRMYYFIGPINATSLREQMLLDCTSDGSGSTNCVCKGNECFKTSIVDIEHCAPKSCDATGRTTILQLRSIGPLIISKALPIVYMLSECGKTISFEPPTTGGPGIIIIRLLSHQGYGCQWYPKTGTEHECNVTLTIKNRTVTSQHSGLNVVLDRNTTKCEGDSLSAYDGASTDSTRLSRWGPCSVPSKYIGILGNSSRITFVFKRAATQYQEDGFNWGFNMQVLLVPADLK